MSYSFITSVKAIPGANGGTTGAVDTTGADLLVITISEYTPGTHTTPSDSKGNTWTELTTRDEGISSQVTIWYAKNATVGTGHTFTYTGTGSYPVIVAMAYSGSHLTAPFDQENGATAGTSNSLQTGNVTPSEDNELIVAAVTHLTSNTAINGGFTMRQHNDTVGGVCMAGGAADLIQTTATAANPTFTASGAGSATAAAIATFKAAAVGPPASAVYTPLIHSAAITRAASY